MFFQQWNQQQQQQQGGAGGILQARLNPGQKQGGDNPTLKGLLNQGPQGPSQPQLGVNISLKPGLWFIVRSKMTCSHNESFLFEFKNKNFSAIELIYYKY